jgi:hypothetical protein
VIWLGEELKAARTYWWFMPICKRRYDCDYCRNRSNGSYTNHYKTI